MSMDSVGDIHSGAICQWSLASSDNAESNLD